MPEVILPYEWPIFSLLGLTSFQHELRSSGVARSTCLSAQSQCRHLELVASSILTLFPHWCPLSSRPHSGGWSPLFPLRWLQGGAMSRSLVARLRSQPYICHSVGQSKCAACPLVKGKQSTSPIQACRVEYLLVCTRLWLPSLVPQTDIQCKPLNCLGIEKHEESGGGGTRL